MTHTLADDMNGSPFGEFIVTDLSDDERAALGVNMELPDPPDEPAQSFDQPDPAAVKPPPRKRSAAQYERKLGDVNRALIKTLAKRPETVPDAAVLVMEGPDFCKAWGNAAAEHDKIARAIDWLSEPTDNALLLAIMATAPIALQVFRNHEPALQPQPRGIRVPFWKDKATGQPRVLRLPKVGLRLDRIPGYTAATNDPDALAAHVFGNPGVQAQMKKAGVTVAGYDSPHH